jgi:hypothetical protein
MTSTLQSLAFSKGGRRTARRPEFSVEVVVDIRSRSAARAVWARNRERVRRTVSMRMVFISINLLIH